MASDTAYNMFNEECLQKYLALSNQKENILRGSSVQFSTASPFSSSTPEWYSSNESSPTYSRAAYTFPTVDEMRAHSPTSAVPRSYPIATAPGLEHRHKRGRSSSNPHTSVDEGNALYDINQQIKATLTELLNTDSVKHDDRFRAYVQSKLMAAEMELKSQRRRRSSEATGRQHSVAMASSICSGLKLSL